MYANLQKTFLNEKLASIPTSLTVAHCSPTYAAVLLFSVCIGVFAVASLVTFSIGKVRSTNRFAIGPTACDVGLRRYSHLVICVRHVHLCAI